MSAPSPQALAKVFVAAVNAYWANPIPVVSVGGPADPRFLSDGDTEAGSAAVRDAVLDSLIAEIEFGSKPFDESWLWTAEFAEWLRSMKEPT